MGWQITIPALEVIPVPKNDKIKQHEVAQLVQRAIALKARNISADVATIESEIDHLVYQLYGLTYDEVLIVDPEMPITREEYEANYIKRK